LIKSKIRVSVGKFGKDVERFIEFNDGEGRGGIIRLHPVKGGLHLIISSLDNNIEIIIGEDK